MRCTMHESNTQTNNPLEPVPEPEPEPLSVEVAFQQSTDLSESDIRKVTLTIANDYDWTIGEVSIAIVDDPTIHRLNVEYLQHDYATDVLSFVLDANSKTGFLSGEIIVSADTAAREAREHSVDAKDELMLYIIHGMLHLVGLDDKEESKRNQMRAAEWHYTDKFGIEYSPPTAASDGGQE